MSVYNAKQPTQAEVPVEEQPELKNSDLIESALARHISECWTKAKFAKMPITERLLRSERQRRGKYDPDRAVEISSTGGSDIYMMLTDIKCRAAYSWIKDVMINMQDKPFDLEPAQDPQLPPEIKMSIIDFVQAEAQEFLAQGQQIHPEAFRVRMEEVHDSIILNLREEAKHSAERMGGLIEDQMDSGGWKSAFDDVVDDFVTFPTAILKGPSIRKKRRLTWGPNFEPIILNDYSRDVERVSPFDIYPSPNSTGVDDGYIIQRHRMTRKALELLKGVPGYSDDNLDLVIERYGKSGLRYLENGDQERDNLEGKPHSRLYRDNIIESLEFWGPVLGETLIEWGVQDKTIKPNQDYEVNAWVCGSYVIRAVINPDPLGQRPYNISSWSRIPGAFWGVGLPEIMRDVQIMCNASARALANNMGIASGPQVEVAIDRLADGEDLTQMYPWKIWQTTSDKTGGGQPGIRFFSPEMKAQELMMIYQSFAKQADEVTGIPNYVYGSSNVSGAGRTASGLSMLMDNAAKGIKQAIANLDVVIVGLVGRFYIHNMMYSPDPYIKGDFKIVATGATGLLAKEQNQMRRNEFLQATANPTDLQIVGIEGRAYLLRELAEGLQMDTDKLVPSPEMLKYKEQQIQMAQAEAAAQQQQQLPAPKNADPAGNPAGGMNTVQPRKMADGGSVEEFDPEGSDYDYQTALAHGMGPTGTGENQGHWGSVAPTSDDERQLHDLPEGSYKVLKGRSHETFYKAEDAERERGSAIEKHGDRYYSIPQHKQN